MNYFANWSLVYRLSRIQVKWNLKRYLDSITSWFYDKVNIFTLRVNDSGLEKMSKIFWHYLKKLKTKNNLFSFVGMGSVKLCNQDRPFEIHLKKEIKTKTSICVVLCAYNKYDALKLLCTSWDSFLFFCLYLCDEHTENSANLCRDNQKWKCVGWSC